MQRYRRWWFVLMSLPLRCLFVKWSQYFKYEFLWLLSKVAIKRGNEYCLHLCFQILHLKKLLLGEYYSHHVNVLGRLVWYIKIVSCRGSKLREVTVRTQRMTLFGFFLSFTVCNFRKGNYKLTVNHDVPRHVTARITVSLLTFLLSPSHVVWTMISHRKPKKRSLRTLQNEI